MLGPGTTTPAGGHRQHRRGRPPRDRGIRQPVLGAGGGGESTTFRGKTSAPTDHSSQLDGTVPRDVVMNTMRSYRPRSSQFK